MLCLRLTLKKKLSPIDEILCKIAETEGQPLYKVEQYDLDYIGKWLSYFDINPPMRDHINICLAQVSSSIVNGNRAPRTKATPTDKFIIDYRKKEPMNRKQIADKVRRFM